MTVGSSPPQTPPQLSPDGRWVWDGHQWQPIPVVVGDVAGVVPVAAAAVAPAPAPVAVAYTPSQVQAPVIPYAVPAAEDSAVPLWVEKPRQGITMYLFAAAALIVLIMAMMALNSLNIVRMPWQSDGQTHQARPTPTPPTPLLAARSESARADHFVDNSLMPAVDAVSQTVPATQAACAGTTLSISCQESITTTAKQMKKLVAVSERADLPPCIVAAMTKMRTDFTAMDSGLVLALSAFKDNKANLLAAGLNKFYSIGMLVPADLKALEEGQKTCNTDRTGP